MYLRLFICLCLPLNLLLAQNDTVKAQLCYDQGKDLYVNGDYEKARAIFLPCLELRLSIYGKLHREVIKTYYRISKTEKRLRNLDAALDAAHTGLSLALEMEKDDSLQIGNFYQELGHLYLGQYDIERAIQHYKRGLQYFLKPNGRLTKEMGGKYMSLGVAFTRMSLFREAANYYALALEAFEASVDPNSVYFNQVYFNLAELYRRQDDAERTISFGLQALEIKLKNYESTHPSVAKYYGLVGEGYKIAGEYEKALIYIQQFVELTQQASGMDHPNTGNAYNSLANLKEDMGQLEEALHLHQQTAQIWENKYGFDHPKVALAYQNTGNDYLKMKAYDQALHFYQTALSKLEQTGYVAPVYHARLLYSIALVQGEQKKYLSALNSVQEGLKKLAPTFLPTEGDIYDNPNSKDVAQVSDLLLLLEFKAELLSQSFDHNSEIRDLQAGLATSELAIDAIEELRRGHQSKKARAYLTSETAGVYELAVEQAFRLYEETKNTAFLTRAFCISERSKANILWQNINEKHAFQFAGIPQVISDSIRQLDQQINQISEATIQLKDAEEYRKQQYHLFELKRKYESLIRNLEIDHPAYYQLKYASPQVDIATYIAHLPSDKTVLLHYFYTPDDCYVFVISKEGLKGFRKSLPDDLPESIQILRQVSGSSQETTSAYIEHLDKLYGLLINPIHDEIKAKANLIIIPHGILQYIPFELLARNNGQQDFRTLNYLLHTHCIQYAWSATLWSTPPAVQEPTTIEFAGFAPGFISDTDLFVEQLDSDVFRNNFGPLPHSISEVETARTYFSGEAYLYQDATETQFLKTAPNSRIIHLATHALANDRFTHESGLMFAEEKDSLEDGFLNTMEIYRLSLNAELAIMSACNSGYGPLAKGEGVMSLGRAFLYAGCQSIITSLWPANDESTSIILKDFYALSATGLAKNEALQQAKINYLKTADPLTAHPYFWANLITVGDMTSLAPSSIINYWLYIVIVGLLLCLTLFFLKKSKATGSVF